MISIDSLQKSFRRNSLLNGFSCEARSGEVTLLVGSNGAGKSTALKIATGALQADAGTVKIGGEDIRRDRARALQLCSSLPQSVDFHPRLTAKQILRFYADVRGAPRERIEQEIERWGLEDHFKKRACELSGGLRQRLGLAVLFLADAPCMVLDEPGISLDPDWRETMQQTLIHQARQGKAILVATHLLGEWQDRADRCLLCENGRVVREIDPQKLRPESPATFKIAAV
ncbi:ABC transporter ATP-binding protein [Pelagicoccus sp. SDUM812003]|uniref:ABC transporter ATP-binding protein n=1 Tax=Pelagicoccus sp. SDUM812003 TaxID=3041267 RepID=UPI00280F78FC|nr:ABC transporter ATP-binding protein [Pelagicoccus sp. SDUM812003]MDQ8202222.1 ABC transporter ATP-binding protein [Pelagicoccus sp. SDUM812003]